jgi:hypothetical protein
VAGKFSWLERPASLREGRRFDSDILHQDLKAYFNVGFFIDAITCSAGASRKGLRESRRVDSDIL